MRSVALALVALVLLDEPRMGGGRGWYLLMPHDEKGRVLVDQPLPKWKHIGSYDTAEACEADKALRFRLETRVYESALDDFWRASRAGASRAELKDKQWSVENTGMLWEAVSWSRCVASDDPRLR